MLDFHRMSQAKKELQGDMSYAIIRNEKLTGDNAKGSYIYWNLLLLNFECDIL